MSAADGSCAEGRDLVLNRHIKAPRSALFRCWTEPDLLTKWIAPAPWKATHAESDLRVGGANLFVMQGPDGEEMPCPGIYLEIEKDRRLVMTDAYVRAWEPSEKPFMTLILTFEDDGESTLYTVRVRHWSEDDRKAHEEMGFHQGWTQCTDQLAELAATL
jgi:uncharacterized protein YndB with AHSA1/START domain